MITLYSGTPGAGKSLHVARDIYTRLLTTKRPVIATFPINMDYITKNGKKKAAEFHYRDITEMDTTFLINHALQHHKLGVENQTLVVIDECQIIFNPREFSRKDRLKWIVFFTQHRKLGYNFVLISQFDRLIDRQIRCLLEYDVIHRKVNNYSFLWMLPIKFFLAITVWYGAKQVCSKEFFIYRKKFGRIYDSFMMFDDDFKEYIKTNGANISQYNRDKLGLDEPPKPNKPTKEEPEKELSEGTECSIVGNEIEKYVEIFQELPNEVSSREVIEQEVNDTIVAIKEEQQSELKPNKPAAAVMGVGGLPCRRRRLSDLVCSLLERGAKKELKNEQKNSLK